jgi:class 3 adenylate cyclase
MVASSHEARAPFVDAGSVRYRLGNRRSGLIWTSNQSSSGGSRGTTIAIDRVPVAREPAYAPALGSPRPTMPNLPTGTVTFLFTDVEGSTGLWEQYPDAMRSALVRHDAVIEFSVEQHRGLLVRPRGEGDSRFAVFARASDAVGAAYSIQRALVTEVWSTPKPLRVRLALHTGEADLRDGDYYGAAVNRCARLRAVAHGGQVLLSGVTAELAGAALPAGVDLRNLGRHRLKDLTEPQQVFQLVHSELPAEFAPLLSLDAHRHNLPVQATSLIGREPEVADVRRRLLEPGVRIVTLTGAGGVNKTRLACKPRRRCWSTLRTGCSWYRWRH